MLSSSWGVVLVYPAYVGPCEMAVGSVSASLAAQGTAHVVKDYTNKAKTDMFLPLSER